MQQVAVRKIKWKLKGKYRIRVKTGCISYFHKDWSRNMLMLVGKDSIMRRLGNLSGGGYVAQLGTGDSTASVNDSQTDLQAAINKAWKSVVPATDINYVRPTLFVQVNFGFTENNWTWNELGIRDNSNVMWARQIDGSPLPKTSAIAATLEWQLTLT